MTQTKLKLKNGTITLPKPLQKSWKGADIFVRVSEDTIVLKKIQKSSEELAGWDKYEEKLRGGRKKIPPKLIDEAVEWAKKQS